MLKLFLIRHGLTEWNKNNRCQGISDIELCDEGIIQAQKLSKRLKDYSFDGIYVSDLKRAYETGEYLTVQHNIQTHKISEFREINYGYWEGLTKNEIIKSDKENYAKWKKSPHTAIFPGEDNLEKVQKRVIVGLNKILNKHKKGNIIIISHGGILKVMILSLLGLDLSCYNKFWLGNTSISIIEIRKGRNNILSLLNDMNHLKED